MFSNCTADSLIRHAFEIMPDRHVSRRVRLQGNVSTTSQPWRGIGHQARSRRIQRVWTLAALPAMSVVEVGTSDSGRVQRHSLLLALVPFTRTQSVAVPEETSS